uniref:Variant surface glycoprotein 1125.322 n=1 Tax=Trypanosoma brucei TaxID=5691 RepID=A0A1J0R5N6_9TRYP|nr:variant surface glycoprotein 1125.322 [Trypanosoma brucei]
MSTLIATILIATQLVTASKAAAEDADNCTNAHDITKYASTLIKKTLDGYSSNDDALQNAYRAAIFVAIRSGTPAAKLVLPLTAMYRQCQTEADDAVKRHRQAAIGPALELAEAAGAAKVLEKVAAAKIKAKAATAHSNSKQHFKIEYDTGLTPVPTGKCTISEAYTTGKAQLQDSELGKWHIKTMKLTANGDTTEYTGPHAQVCINVNSCADATGGTSKYEIKSHPFYTTAEDEPTDNKYKVTAPGSQLKEWHTATRTHTEKLKVAETLLQQLRANGPKQSECLPHLRKADNTLRRAVAALLLNQPDVNLADQGEGQKIDQAIAAAYGDNEDKFKNKIWSTVLEETVSLPGKTAAPQIKLRNINSVDQLREILVKAEAEQQRSIAAAKETISTATTAADTKGNECTNKTGDACKGDCKMVDGFCKPAKKEENKEKDGKADSTCAGKDEKTCGTTQGCKWENNACKDSSILVNKKFALSVVSAAFVALLF